MNQRTTRSTSISQSQSSDKSAAADCNSDTDTDTPAEHHMTQASSQEPQVIPEYLKVLIEKTVQNEIQNLSENLELAQNENADLKRQIWALERRVELSEGLLARTQTKLEAQSEKLIDLQARSMRDNIIFRGIPESNDGETWAQSKEKVVQFMKTELKIETAGPEMIDRAHRQGPKPRKGSRNIVVKFTSSNAKDLIFKHVKNLAGKKDLSVQEQYPPEIQERRKRLWPKYKKERDIAKLNKSHKVNWSLDKLNVNGKLHSAKDHFQVITPDDLPKKDDDPLIMHTTQTCEGGSTFAGHAATLSCDVTVPTVLAKVMTNQVTARADHNIFAFRISKGNDVIEGQSDDGEHGASGRIMKLLQEKSITNCIIIVTRWFGGRHIGPKRFEMIEDRAKEALNMLDNKTPGIVPAPDDPELVDSLTLFNP